MLPPEAMLTCEGPATPGGGGHTDLGVLHCSQGDVLVLMLLTARSASSIAGGCEDVHKLCCGLRASGFCGGCSYLRP